MFDSLSEKLDQTIRRLRGLGKITDRNIEEAVREVRLALLEADVHFQVAKEFTERVRQQALGQEVLQSLTPAQHFVKIVAEELSRVMGGESKTLDFQPPPPAVVLVVGLQGSGKTTSVAKLARHLAEERRRKPYLVSVDIYRPAAMEQLAVLAAQAGLPIHPARPSGLPVEIAREAVQAAKQAGHDTVLIDTAGRLHIDQELMQELEEIQAAVQPQHVLLVVDAMTGQDALQIARGFHDRLGVSGVILTKLDGDARGGAALSVRMVTGAPILFAGTGEKLDRLEVFHPDRMARRILGMGDVLSLVERAERAYDAKRAEELQRKLKRNEFTIEDFREQLRAVRKMGAMSELLGMIPGMKKFARGVDLGAAEEELKRIEAIINSMTKAERQNHLILNASRRRRIAQGSGTSVAEVNKFLKQFEQTRKIMKQMTKAMGRGGLSSRMGF
ncbi:MAG: signal recognition particle protein [Candidatus Binatia bacterium]|nr:MAG: signal recognition particle protein [Candidatus Binatia bacterium]